jgi:hypothetical protein
MGLFSKKEKVEETIEKPPCPHSALVPRWDSIDDIGRDDRATSYVCEACGEQFSPEEGRMLQQSMAERLPVGDS